MSQEVNMEQTVIIAYAILLMINTVIFLLCAVQMRKFSRFYRNFNKVVSNVQAYLQYVMEERENWKAILVQQKQVNSKLERGFIFEKEG